jgi:hypothetical protein
MIMDVCDDHFDGKWRTHYLEACSLADTITCNSQVMREVIQDHTGIDAVVIDDPYEDPELSPTSGDGVLWFGHSANLPDLEGIREQIKYPLTIIDSRNYTPQALDSALKACRCVIIPTGDKQAKSANRAIKAIRYGKFPVCGPLPAYVEIGLEMDFLTSLDWAMSEDTSAKVKSLQDSIRDRFCPEKVAKDWWKVMS